MKTTPLPCLVTGRCISAGRLTSLDGHYFEREPGFMYWTLGGAWGAERYAAPPGRPMQLRAPYSLAMTEPNTPYVARHDPGRVESLWVIFEAGTQMTGLLNWPAQSPGMRYLPLEGTTVRDLAFEALGQAVDAFSMAHPQRGALAMNAIMRLLMLVSPLVEAQGGSKPDLQVASAIQAIHDDPARAWTVAELAKAAHMSESNLAHRFREETGMSPVRYAQERRMARAREMLLMTNEPICAIADALGFLNAFHFSTRFRAMTGKSPRAYRHAP
jgi:AraC family transcriptional regulator, arabinose operon regulatory protein